jgi:AraC-like DNA-binding protein
LDSANGGLLGRLLPTVVHIQASDPATGRLRRTIDLIVEEALADRPGRDLVVERLIEVVLVEALRFRTESVNAIGQPGLLAGLADPLLARALRQLHDDVAHAWSVEELAREAGLSRSAFSERFSQKVGVAPMQYLIDWRIALAKAMLQRDAPPLEAVAAAIGYQSASAFSTAFRRAVGSPPSQFARAGAG